MYAIQIKDTKEYLTLIHLGEAFWTSDYREALLYEPGSEELKKAKDFLINVLNLKIRLVKV